MARILIELDLPDAAESGGACVAFVVTSAERAAAALRKRDVPVALVRSLGNDAAIVLDQADGTVEPLTDGWTVLGSMRLRVHPVDVREISPVITGKLSFNVAGNSRSVMLPNARGTRFRIGRSRWGNDLRIADGKASRRHASIVPDRGGFVLTDLGSSRGTFVNDERIGKPRLLAAGDRITLGQTTLTFDAAIPADGRLAGMLQVDESGGESGGDSEVAATLATIPVLADIDPVTPR